MCEIEVFSTRSTTDADTQLTAAELDERPWRGLALDRLEGVAEMVVRDDAARRGPGQPPLAEIMLLYSSLTERPVGAAIPTPRNDSVAKHGEDRETEADRELDHDRAEHI